MKDLEDSLYIWIVKLRSSHVPVQVALVQERALRAAEYVVNKHKDAEESIKKKLHYDALKLFKASNGWYSRFAKHYGLSSGKISGEAGSAPVEVAQEGREDLQKILEEYDPDNVFNMDEAGLFYLMLPDRSIMACKSEKGTKRAKSRVTVVFIVNMTGTMKLPVLVIGKSKRPRCFGKLKASSLPCDYTNSSKAWMTGKIFTDILVQLNLKMRNKNRKIVLLVDGAGS